MNDFINSHKNSRGHIVLSVILAACLIIFTFTAGAKLLTGTRAQAEDAISSMDNTNSDNSGETQETSGQIADKPQETPWYLILVNKDNPIPEDFTVTLADVDKNHQIDVRIADALKSMLGDCRRQGLDPLICSSYRSNEDQESLFDAQLRKKRIQGMTYEQSFNEARITVAYPGTSEHQVGLAVDIVSISNQVLDQKQEQTKVYQWLKKHCSDYGFIVRYPNGKTDITGIIYEPWHFRYVGVEAAQEIMAKGITLEEYLNSQS